MKNINVELSEATFERWFKAKLEKEKARSKPMSWKAFFDSLIQDTKKTIEQAPIVNDIENIRNIVLVYMKDRDMERAKRYLATMIQEGKITSQEADTILV